MGKFVIISGSYRVFEFTHLIQSDNKLVTGSLLTNSNDPLDLLKPFKLLI